MKKLCECFSLISSSCKIQREKTYNLLSLVPVSGIEVLPLSLEQVDVLVDVVSALPAIDNQIF